MGFNLILGEEVGVDLLVDNQIKILSTRWEAHWVPNVATGEKVVRSH